MSRRIARSLALLLPLVTVVVVTGPAQSQLVDEEAVGRLTVGGGLGFLLPSMNQVNNNIDVVNPFLNRDEVRSLDHVNAGLLTHADIRYRLGNTPPEEADEKISFTDRLSIGFSWGAINARSEFDVSRVGTRFFTRATVYHPYLLYHLPFFEAKAPRTQLYLGGGPMFVKSGKVDWSVDDRTNNSFLVNGDVSELAGKAEASGSATGLSVMLGGAFMLSPRFSVALDVGYRKAVMSNLSLDSVEGQDKRFPGDDDPETEEVVRRLGDWTVIDFFMRDPNAEFEGTNRTDPTDDGGCADCPLYFQGGNLEVDYSGPFSTITFRVHF